MWVEKVRTSRCRIVAARMVLPPLGPWLGVARTPDCLPTHGPILTLGGARRPIGERQPPGVGPRVPETDARWWDGHTDVERVGRSRDEPGRGGLKKAALDATGLGVEVGNRETWIVHVRDQIVRPFR